ncbi:hypothetical protein NMY22_g7159 [Coprinellus aureogranulatus]|nr:hypothetical protein NMY22_g7159 [Coprinellus aureogranulatus]
MAPGCLPTAVGTMRSSSPILVHLCSEALSRTLKSRPLSSPPTPPSSSQWFTVHLAVSLLDGTWRTRSDNRFDT